MRPLEAVGVLDNVLRRFGDAVALASFDSHLAGNNATRAYADLASWLAKRRTPPVQTPGAGQSVRNGGLVFAAWTASVARDLETAGAERVAVGGKSARHARLLDAICDGYNGTQMWQLLRAFEGFERFTKELFAAIGYLDDELWLAADFGKVRIAETRNWSLDNYNESVRARRDRLDASTLVGRIRTILPDVEHDEKLHPDAAVWVRVITFFRHMIVHDHGQMAAIAFWKLLDRESGIRIWKGDQGHRWYREVARYLRRKDGKVLLWLIDSDSIAQRQAGFIGQHRGDPGRPIYFLLERLTSYASLMYAKAIRHFGNVPFWKREETATDRAS